MTITAEAVKQLRERTGAGMMECKKALVEAGGNLDAAADLMRRQGLAKADKKATRIAAEGIVVAQVRDHKRHASLVEVNCETDFVAREGSIRHLATQAADLALEHRPSSVEALLQCKLSAGGTLDEFRRGLVAKIGENITVRRFAVIEAETIVGSYIHGTRIGALVALKGGDEALARELAMHVAAMNPEYISAADVPADIVSKEREIFAEQVKGEGKPAEIAGRIVDGKLRKRLNEISLTGQIFIKDDKATVESLLKKAGAQVTAIVRFEVGAGIEKKQH
ncbi:MAG TPA: translation elongation factor Ts [Steroidobacteraceae bacterium]|jgi:elongation factor Ts